MPALEVFDSVVLKANRQLVGIVDRTFYENNHPLQDILIIAHVSVDPDVLTKFVNTGTPPKNYVFVRFSDEAQGSSLVHEDDVILLDRSFNLGDVVKREDSQTLGTITSVTEKYVVQPVWLNTFNLLDGTPSATTVDQIISEPRHTCTPECPSGVLSDIEHPWQSCLLHNIPGDELKKAEDVLEADFIIQDDWLGIVEELDLMVIIVLEDESIVVVKEPDELYIPVADSGKPLVSLPEFDNLARPDPLVALQEWSATIPPHDFQCGQMVVTNQRNLRLGRWLRGQYNPNVKPQGRVLDVRARSVDVRWLACNAFVQEQPSLIRCPHVQTTLYDNINTFPNRAELRSNKQVLIYDHSRFPRLTESRVRRGEADPSTIDPTVHTPTDFRVGDHVKFRDQAGAALKYQGVACKKDVVHGRFDRIASASTYGFDVNEFKIICSRQECVVLWQDGTFSNHSSKSLVKFTLFETELAPADLVVAREGMRQVPSESQSAPAKDAAHVDFNEMKFFESPHDLLPKRVGVVQNVNQAERVAQVRWFLEPDICLTNYGHYLTAESRLGRLSYEVEDVSLYEIMTFPALTRRLKDLVIIPPQVVSSKASDQMHEFLREDHRGGSDGQTLLSQINQYGKDYLAVCLQIAAFGITRDMPPPKIADPASYKLHPAEDWMGEIVELGLDGVITVRLNLRSTSKDVRLEHDQIICLIDEAAISNTDTLGAEMNTDSEMEMSIDGSEDADTASTISETVEYEGGERLDSDSGDENWEDADDDEMVLDEKAIPNTATSNITPITDLSRTVHDTEAVSQKAIEAVEESPEQMQTSKPTDSLLALKSSLPTSEPAAFAVLDQESPRDQYQGPKGTPASSSTFLKRIAKEHRILASSLPQGEIFVRTYENRLDLMRCLILGPADTPYEHAPFLIDLQLGKNFPREPPVAHFHSWTSGLGRINPNLYEEGKICLSLLGTWPGKAEHESWTERATILQLLVSIQGLVFVRQPFYNEAGFEDYAEDNSYRVEAQRYNEKAYVMARGFVKHAVTTPVRGLEDVLAWLYLAHDESPGLLRTIITQSSSLIDTSERGVSDNALVDGKGSQADQTKVFLRPLSRGAIVMLRKTINSLGRLLADSADVVMAEPAE